MVTVSGAGGFTKIVNALLELVKVESATVIVNVLVPDPVGSPAIVTELPEPPCSESPAGSAPEETLHVKGLLPPLTLTVPL